MSSPKESGAWGQRLLALLASLAVLAALFAVTGCGDDDDEGDDRPAEAGDVGERLNALGFEGGAKAGQGKTWKLGAVLPLSGSGSFYGKVMKEGVELAVKHIREAGGPDIQVSYKDHKSGNPEAGAQATREFGAAGHHAVLGSYLADFGAMLPGLERYKMLSLDGGGGTGIFFQGKPFFWGTRGITPDDSFPGTYQWVSQAMPDAKRVAFVIWDAGPEYVDATAANLEKALGEHGLELVATETVPIGATDYSSTYSRLKEADADIVQLAIWGPDPGHFMRGYAGSGNDAQVIGVEYLPDSTKVAGPAYDDYLFTFDFFNATDPPNEWAKLFVEEYERAYGDKPVYYAANFYENVFAYWELVKRVLAQDGDINSGPELQKALTDDPTFKSVYGSAGEQAGTYTLDLETHTVTDRPLGLFKPDDIPDATATPIATFNIGGRDFEVVDEE